MYAKLQEISFLANLSQALANSKDTNHLEEFYVQGRCCMWYGRCTRRRAPGYFKARVEPFETLSDEAFFT